MDELQKQLEKLQLELKTYVDSAQATGKTTVEQKSAIDNLISRLDEIDKKMVARHDSTEEKTLTDVLKETEDLQRLMRNKSGRATFTLEGKYAQMVGERKTVTTPATLTPGVTDADRLPGIVTEARRPLVIRDVLSARPTSLPLVYWVKVNSPLQRASPQVEAAAKHENAVTFTTANSPVKTLATFIKASRQALDDFSELAGFLQSGLPYYVNVEEERQLLSGDNTGENLNGLITQATAFDTALLSAAAGYTRLDQIGAAIQQIGVASEIDPTFVIVNKTDWWKIRRTKDSQGRYILGDPQSMGSPTLWGLTVVASNAITAGTFLVGSGDSVASEIRDRMQMEVAISYEDSDNFEKNLVTIRAEKRLVLTVLRPASYITGTFAVSPASLG